MARTPATNMQKVTILDENGKEIIGYLPARNPLVPRADGAGVVPEFVNVSGKTQLIRFDVPGTDPIPVRAWDIIKGAQFRNMADRTKAWGKDHAPFRERERIRKGEVDAKYLLTTDQMVADVSRMVGVTVDYGRMRLRDYRDHGMIEPDSREDTDGYPLVSLKTVRDDRAKVVNAVSDRMAFLDDREQREKARGFVM